MGWNRSSSIRSLSQITSLAIDIRAICLALVNDRVKVDYFHEISLISPPKTIPTNSGSYFNPWPFIYK